MKKVCFCHCQCVEISEKMVNNCADAWRVMKEKNESDKVGEENKTENDQKN